MEPQLFVGTAGWGYEWDFYPDDVQDKLRYYAGHFASVEINNTFYQLPRESSLKQWCDAVPADFRFSIKASRYITHLKKLKDPQEPLNSFLPTADALGDKLAVILFQLPGNWRMNHERLADFLAALPEGYRAAFEFRDPSWHAESTYDLLRAHNAAFCINEFGGLVSPKIVTADFVYLRLHGPRTPYEGGYDDQTLAGWAGAITSWLNDGKSVYCYFDNDETGHAPHDAKRLQGMLKTYVPGKYSND